MSETPIATAVRQELHRLVRQDRRTREEIAEALGVTPETLRRRLNGEARQRFADAEALLVALGFSPLYLAEVVRIACVRCGARAPVAFAGALILPADPAAPEWSTGFSATRHQIDPRADDTQSVGVSAAQVHLAKTCEQVEGLLDTSEDKTSTVEVTEKDDG